jgi:hypothetical protein
LNHEMKKACALYVLSRFRMFRRLLPDREPKICSALRKVIFNWFLEMPWQPARTYPFSIGGVLTNDWRK